jgi:hypothetical protein
LSYISGEFRSWNCDLSMMEMFSRLMAANHLAVDEKHENLSKVSKRPQIAAMYGRLADLISFYLTA